jgi:hypothetical protein
VLGESCRHRQDLLALPHCNVLHFSNLLHRSIGWRVAPTLDDNWALKSSLPESTGRGELK